MSYSSDLSDKDWVIIEPLLSSMLKFSGSGRRSQWSNRELLNGMLYQLKNGYQDLRRITLLFNFTKI